MRLRLKLGAEVMVKGKPALTRAGAHPAPERKGNDNDNE
jgi:hypothetical protein